MYFIYNLCSNNNNNSNNPDDYLRCKLNGTLWESTTSEVGGIYMASTGMLTFSGDDGSTMYTANLAGITDTGTYAVGVGTLSAMQVFTGGQFYYMNADYGQGSFTLEEIKSPGTDPHNFKGSFEGVATNASNDSIFVTEGVFENF